MNISTIPSLPNPPSLSLQGGWERGTGLKLMELPVQVTMAYERTIAAAENFFDCFYGLESSSVGLKRLAGAQAAAAVDEAALEKMAWEDPIAFEQIVTERMEAAHTARVTAELSLGARMDACTDLPPPTLIPDSELASGVAEVRKNAPALRPAARLDRAAADRSGALLSGIPVRRGAALPASVGELERTAAAGARLSSALGGLVREFDRALVQSTQSVLSAQNLVLRRGLPVAAAPVPPFATLGPLCEWLGRLVEYLGEQRKRVFEYNHFPAPGATPATSTSTSTLATSATPASPGPASPTINGPVSVLGAVIDVCTTCSPTAQPASTHHSDSDDSDDDPQSRARARALRAARHAEIARSRAAAAVCGGNQSREHALLTTAVVDGALIRAPAPGPGPRPPPLRTPMSPQLPPVARRRGCNEALDTLTDLRHTSVLGAVVGELSRGGHTSAQAAVQAAVASPIMLTGTLAAASTAKRGQLARKLAANNVTSLPVVGTNIVLSLWVRAADNAADAADAAAEAAAGAARQLSNMVSARKSLLVPVNTVPDLRGVSDTHDTEAGRGGAASAAMCNEIIPPTQCVNR